MGLFSRERQPGTPQVVKPGDVWVRINKDSDFKTQSKASREAMRPYIEAMPVILEDMVDHKVSLESLVRAKITFIRYSVENGAVEASINSLSPDERRKLNMSSSQMVEQQQQLIDSLELFAQDIPGALKAEGLPENVKMLTLLNREAGQIYLKNQLTIRKLLLVDPAAIYKNSDR